MVFNHPKRSPSLAGHLNDDDDPMDTASGRRWSSIDSRNKLAGTLPSCSRGQVAMNYHHDHLLHQRWPSKERPPLRTGKCAVCPKQHGVYPSAEMQMVEAFAEECFYCRITLEVLRLHSTNLSPHALAWIRDPWYNFNILCDYYPSTNFAPIGDEVTELSPELFLLSGVCNLALVECTLTTSNR
jgi:hypothetical protein